MKCMICNNQMEYYFTKKFDFSVLKTVEYVKCVFCGFVMSKTHYELSSDDWNTLNKDYHSSYQGNDSNKDDPRWIERLETQAAIIADAEKLGIISRKLPWVDFGCGDGKLSSILKQNYNLDLGNFDRYMNNNEFLTDEYLTNNTFDFVITTSVFEHLLKREMLEEINSLVSDNGVMGVHLLVAEHIPNDPDWFYLLPVHCAFFTNKAMQILFDDWGYTSSMYSAKSQLWLLLKSDPCTIEPTVNKANSRHDHENFHYHYKRGFMDYWKLNKNEVLVRQKTKERGCK